MRRIDLKHKVIALFAFLLVASSAFAQKTYVVAVGLNNYAPGGNCTPLPCSIGDATAISKFFYGYNNSDVFMLKDNNATRDHIIKVLKAQFAKATENDEVIFAYSGHGFDGGITCYDSDGRGNTKIIYCTEIQEILRKTKARRKVMFINSCHSGSFSKKYGNDPKSKSYKNSNSNVMLYLSSRANEYSWEHKLMDNSYFFHYLIKGLEGAADKNGDRKVTARELFNYVNEQVIYITDGIQHPQMYGKFPDDMVVVYVK